MLKSVVGFRLKDWEDTLLHSRRNFDSSSCAVGIGMIDTLVMVQLANIAPTIGIDIVLSSFVL